MTKDAFGIRRLAVLIILTTAVVLNARIDVVGCSVLKEQ